MKLSFKHRESERRRHRRLVMEAPVGLALWRPLSGWLTRRPRLEGKTINASMGGLELALDRPLAVGSRLKLWIQVETGGSVEALVIRGDVRWMAPRGPSGMARIGIHFEERANPALQAWRETMLEELRSVDALPADIRGRIRPRGRR